MLSIVHVWWNRLFTLDVRSLAVMRIGLAFIVLIDLLVRAQGLSIFYGSQGVLPHALWHYAFEPSAFPWSVHLLFGGPLPWLILLFLMHAVAAGCMLFGYRTRSATIVTWFLLCSLHNANPLILTGGDHLLQLLLFIGIFLPLGQVLSVDSVRDKKQKTTQVISGWSAALVLQFVFVYLFAALWKHSAPWMFGSAVSLVLSMDATARGTADFLLQYPQGTAILTYTIFYLQHLVPFLLLCPYRTKLIRFITIIALVCMHIAFTIFLHIGLFSWIMIAGLLALIPPEVWDYIAPATDKTPLEKPESQKTWSLLGGVYIAFALVNNASTTPVLSSSITVPLPIHEISNILLLNQTWDLFALQSLSNDQYGHQQYIADGEQYGWSILEGTTKDGSHIDLLHDGIPVSFDRPDTPSAVYPNELWRKYLLRLNGDLYAPLRPQLGQVICERWNVTRATSERLEKVQLIFMFDPIEGALVPGASAIPITKMSFSCPN